MKCSECSDYDFCRRYNDLRSKRKRCEKAKKPAMKTNADRIRSMTDEEMAEMFSGLEDNISDCVSAWLDWLKQPSEED